MILSSELKKHAVSISPNIVVFTFAFALFLFFLYQITSIIILLFLSFIIMTALRPAVDKLNFKYRVPRALSTALVYISVLFILGALMALVLPPLLTEAYKLLRSFNLPFLQQELQSLSLTVQEISALLSQVGNGANIFFSVINSTFNSVFAFFTLIVTSFYLMMDRPNLHKKFVWFTKDAKQLKLAEDFINSVESQLGGWIRGQVILMLVIGVVTYLGLIIFSVPYALPLAILAGLLEILPNLGPTLAAVPAVILAFVMGGPVMAGMVTLFYILIQQFENNLLVPKIMQANADVNPLVAIVVILIGLKLGGVVGALLSIPTYIILRSLYSLARKHEVRLF